MTGQGHAQLMDSVYRNQRFFYDATRKFYLLGRDRLIDELDVPPGGSVLEIACGTGRNLALVGKRYPDAALYGVDISAQMLTTARQSLNRAGLADRVTLAEADACDFDPATLLGQDKFDRVFLSYSLSMIPDWEGALREALRHLAAGGALSFVDFGQFSGYPRWFRSAMNGWLARFHVAPRGNVDAFLESLGHEAGGDVVTTRLYRDYAVAGTLRNSGERHGTE